MTERTVDTPPGAIAVVGMAGRFPGAPDLGRYWSNILAGRHAMRDLTEEELRAGGVAQRWIDHPDYVRTAAVLDDADRFDAALFDITPREAALMDPQHRVFLETCWEALEHAGRLAPYGGGSRGASSVGVFGGSGGVLAGYLPEVLGSRGRFLDPTAALEHLGNDKDFLATRVSYKLGLTGPGLTVQTACSTSLVAVHLACQSLLLGECDTAVAGGVTIRVPSLAGYLHQDQGILSPDGRCRPFDARARGTVFGSGAGAVVLRPLADALRDGDTVYAVVRGTAVNNDGDRKTSYGASTLDGQLAAMRQALTVAEVPSATIGYVEAHGTGTLLGDPLEVAAIRRALGDEARCAIGSVKALVGHLEAAAGVAGLIKTVLSVHHGVLPPSPHVDELNPRLRLEGSGLRVNREAEPWEAADGPRRAAVNSLGIGGTNAFAVLEQAPDHPARTPERLPRELLTVTAKTADALRAAARRWADDLRERRDDELADLAHTSQVGRRRLPHRVSVLAGFAQEAADELENWLDGRPGTGVVHGTGDQSARVGFLFTGQGSQYAGMAAELHERHAGFRAALERHADLFRDLTGASPEDVLCDRERGPQLLRRAEILQPATYLLQLALHDVLGSWGVRPEAVAGHSLGEFAAAHAAGVLGAEDGLRLVAERGAAIAEAAAPGGMLAVRCPDLDALRALIEPYGDELAVAGHNTPDLLTLSGTRAALDEIRPRLRERRWAVVDLDVTHAFHSPLMAPAADRLLRAAGSTEHHPSRIDLVTNVTGTASGVDSGYWARQLTSPVLFRQTLDTLLAQGVTHFVEVGPGRALTGYGRARRGTTATWLDLLTARGSDWDTLQHALGVLDTDGVRVDWAAFHAPLRRRRVAAPGYPFARDRHWVAEGGSTAARAADTPAALTDSPAGRGALDDLTRIPLPQSPQRRWATGADARTPALLGDHVLLGEVVVPGAYHTACLLEAYGAERPVLIEDLVFPRALVVGEEPSSVQVVFDAPRDGAGEARVLGLRPGAPAHLDSAWTVHAQGRVSTPATVPAAAADGRGLRAEDEPGTGTGPDGPARKLSGDELYARLDRLSYRLGPAFRWIGELRQDGPRIEADITVPEFLDPASRPARTVLIDVCVQTAIGVCVADLDHLDGLLLPFRAERALFHPVTAVPRTGRILATLRSLTAPADGAAPGGVLDIRVEDPAGRALVELTGLELRLVPPHALTAGTDEPATVHAQTWRPADDPVPGTAPAPRRWLVLADRQGLWRQVAADLAADGADCAVLHDGAPHEATATVRQVADLADPDRLAEALPPAWADGTPVGVVHCAALDLTTATPDDALLRRALGSVPALLQALRRTGRPAPAVLTLLTRGAVSGVAARAAANPQQFTLWGTGRSAVHELPDTAVRLVDLDPGPDTGPAGLRHALTGTAGTETVLRDGRAHVPALETHRTAPEAEFRVRPDGCHLITGGLGALGLRTAHWLAEHGARHLVLTGRRTPDETARRAVAELEATGVQVTVLTADVAERAAADALVAAIRDLGVPLRGVFHSAGVVEDATLAGLGWDAFARVLAPKVAGAWNLHLATAAEDLDHFVLYSSTAALLGSAGQAHYAAANAYLDALAHHRRAGGLPALSVAWGPVTAGMTARLDRRLRERMAATGFTLADPRRVFTAVGRLLAGAHDPVHGVFELDWSVHLARFAPDRLPANRPAGARARTGTGASGRGGQQDPADRLLRDWATAPADRRRDLAAGYLTEVLAQRVGTDASTARTDASLTALGVDSMIAIEIRSQIRSELGVDLPLTLLLQDEPVRRVEEALHDGLHRVAGSAVEAGGPPPEETGATTGDGPVSPEAAADLLASVHHLDDAELDALAALLAVTEQES